jgi:hypothetical protein
MILSQVLLVFDGGLILASLLDQRDSQQIVTFAKLIHLVRSVSLHFRLCVILCLAQNNEQGRKKALFRR